jgi:hypothetical protein
MTDGNNNRRAKTDPAQNKARAWKIAINPGAYSKSQRKLLIQKRGEGQYDSFQDLFNDLSQFIADALDRRVVSREKPEDFLLEDPHDSIADPGRMALLMSLGSTLIQSHDIIKNDPRDPVIQNHIRYYYLDLLFTAASRDEHQEEIRTALGEVVYSRDAEDDYGPPAGNVIEGLTSFPNHDCVYKLPLAHANRMCEARTGYKKDGALRSLIKGPYIFIPYDDVHLKYKEKFVGRNRVASTLEQVISLSINNGQKEKFLDSLTGITGRIENLLNTGNDNVIFKDRRYPAKIKAILRAVEGADADVAQLGKPLTATQISEAVRDYTTWTDYKWIKNMSDSINTPRAVAMVLSKNKGLNHITVYPRDGQPDLYELEYKIGDFKQIDVSGIESLLEFPCMASLHDSLMEKKPVRWELYSFVRYLYEIDEVDFGVEDIKDWFRQYPWYDPDITEYQVGHEEEQTMADDDRPLPISCNNDNRSWAEHCIGKENCEYSLYRSVDLRPDIYDRTGDD